MPAAELTINPRTRSTPYTSRVEAAGVRAYTVYNHTLLPTAFQSLEDDYRHLKQHVQLWDVSCERQVEIRGPDAARLVQLMTPRDLSRATVGRCLYAPLVDQTGAMINDPVVLKLADDRFWLSIADSDVLLWASGLAFGLGLEVTVDEPEIAPLAVQGPKSDALMTRVFGEAAAGIRFFRFEPLDFRGHSLIVARSGWSKQGGFEIYLDNPSLGLELWDALWEAGEDLDVGAGSPNLIERIEGGLLSYGSDMTRDNNPFECGLDAYVSLDRPIEFMARDALARIASVGPARRIMGLRVEAQNMPRCQQRWPVTSDGKQVGLVSSAAMSPDFGCGLALAMMERDFWTPGTRVEIRCPDKRRFATLSGLPFQNPD
ncbi:MAG: dimethylsulfoniopropionate demethylase [Gammaproteobacteria bacterium]|nr:dimethylsulfoniopropionate demethylase [Gammaproteobacteria bacterium]